MLAAETQSHALGTASGGALPLENGEVLHSREFLFRYERMSRVKKAELIEGVVFMGSPVSVHHARPDGIIHAWLATYASRHPGTEALANVTVILDSENTLQPDSLLRRLPAHGGLSRVNAEDYLTGPPELVVEVAGTSASIDLRDKRRAYCRNGVLEYLVWVVSEARFEWGCLIDEAYRLLEPDAQGVLHSRVFPGLRLPVAAALAGDAATVLAALT
ncbi:MAG: Uma2 family endonuclease [Verrucomicrobiales bacterium]|nr:Uma2 family endonuclease [Verrucomicrobiales bacterium]